MATKESKLDIELATMIVNVKSRILEGIARTLADPEKFADCTSTYTKSDGTNYGMYQKTCSVSAYEEIWETVSGRVRLIAPTQVQARTAQAKE